jgi:hypothetical protein
MPQLRYRLHYCVAAAGGGPRDGAARYQSATRFELETKRVFDNGDS